MSLIYYCYFKVARQMPYVSIEQAQQRHASILFGPLCREEMVLTSGKIRKVAKNHVEQARGPRWPWYSRKQLPSLVNTINVPGQPSQAGRCQCKKQLKPHVVHWLSCNRDLHVTSD